jgi:hypothetical protein
MEFQFAIWISHIFISPSVVHIRPVPSLGTRTRTRTRTQTERRTPTPGNTWHVYGHVLREKKPKDHFLARNEVRMKSKKDGWHW